MVIVLSRTTKHDIFSRSFQIVVHDLDWTWSVERRVGLRVLPGCMDGGYVAVDQSVVGTVALEGGHDVLAFNAVRHVAIRSVKVATVNYNRVALRRCSPLRADQKVGVTIDRGVGCWHVAG